MVSAETSPLMSNSTTTGNSTDLFNITTIKRDISQDYTTQSFLFNISLNTIIMIILGGVFLLFRYFRKDMKTLGKRLLGFLSEKCRRKDSRGSRRRQTLHLTTGVQQQRRTALSSLAKDPLAFEWRRPLGIAGDRSRSLHEVHKVHGVSLPGHYGPQPHCIATDLYSRYCRLLAFQDIRLFRPDDLQRRRQPTEQAKGMGDFHLRCPQLSPLFLCCVSLLEGVTHSQASKNDWHWLHQWERQQEKASQNKREGHGFAHRACEEPASRDQTGHCWNGDQPVSNWVFQEWQSSGLCQSGRPV